MASEWPLGLPLAVRYGSGRYAAIVAADAALTPKQREDVAANWERLRKGAVHVRCAENPTLFRRRWQRCSASPLRACITPASARAACLAVCRTRTSFVR